MREQIYNDEKLLFKKDQDLMIWDILCLPRLQQTRKSRNSLSEKCALAKKPKTTEGVAGQSFANSSKRFKDHGIHSYKNLFEMTKCVIQIPLAISAEDKNKEVRRKSHM